MAIHKVDGVDGVNNFPKKFVTLYASEAITVGTLVALDLTDTTNGAGASIRPADVATDATAGGGQPIALGFATETVAAGKNCKVQTAGQFANALVHSSTAIGDSLYASIVAGSAYPTAEAYAGVQTVKVTGAGSSTNIAVTGILTTDELISALHFDSSDPAVDTLSASITSDGNIQTATDTGTDADDGVIVTWRRDLNKVAYALEAYDAAGTDVMILDQGLF
jgi:hypothetical protein